MSESLFLNIIHRYFIKSIVLKKVFLYKNFERFYRINFGNKSKINKFPTSKRDTKIKKGFISLFWSFILKMFGIKQLTQLEKFEKEINRIKKVQMEKYA